MILAHIFPIGTEFFFSTSGWGLESILYKLFFLLALACPAWGVVAFDTVASKNDLSNPSPITVTLTVGVGSNRALVVTFATQDTLTPSTPTGAGATWSLFNSSTDGVVKFFMWSGTNPSTGSQTVSISFTGTPSLDHHAAVWSWNGVDQTTPLASYIHQTTTDVVVTTVNGDGAVSEEADTASARSVSGCTTTTDFQNVSNTAYNGAHCSATGSTVTFSWSNVTGGGAIGAAVKQAAAVAAGTYLLYAGAP